MIKHLWQEEYCNNELAPLSAKVFYVQASHFVIGCYSMSTLCGKYLSACYMTGTFLFMHGARQALGCMGMHMTLQSVCCIDVRPDMVNFEEVMNVVQYVLPFEQLRVHAALVVSSRQFVPMPVSPHVLLSLSSITFFFCPLPSLL